MGRYEELLEERRARLTAEAVAGTPLFRETPFPTAPAAEAEQQGLGLEGSAEALYRRWRATAEGEETLRALRAIAREWVAQGATRIGSRALWEEGRRRLKRLADNRLQALACREVEDTTPVLRGLFRHRERKAS